MFGRLLYLLFPSDAAVTLFFVLSGHVLWQSFQRSIQKTCRRPIALQTAFDLPDYIVGRLYRLLPTLMVSCLVMAALTATPVADLVKNMLLLDHNLIGVSWSLQVEAVCSLALFMVHRLSRGSTAGTVICLVLIIAPAGFFRGSNFFLFFPAFLLGALIGSVPSGLWRKSLIPIGYSLLACGSLFLTRHAPGRVCEIIGATLLIGSSGALQPRILLTPALVFLGEISYPFYLAHPLGLLWTHRLLDGSLLQTSAFNSILMMAVVSIAMALPTAWLLHVCVERPLMIARPRLKQAAGRLPAACAARVPLQKG